jgi:hypothetical protein
MNSSLTVLAEAPPHPNLPPASGEKGLLRYRTASIVSTIPFVKDKPSGRVLFALA